MRPLPRTPLVVALLVVGCSGSYHAGDAAARKWDTWVAEHPLTGAEVTDRGGRNRARTPTRSGSPGSGRPPWICLAWRTWPCPARDSRSTSTTTARSTGPTPHSRPPPRTAAGSVPLTVTPARVSTEVPLTGPGRRLLERLSTDTRVLAAHVGTDSWNLATRTTGEARGLLRFLDGEGGTGDLGRLVLYVGTDPYRSATGTGRSCFLRPTFDESRDRALDLRLKGPDPEHANLRGALACLRRMPFGQPVYLQLPQNNTASSPPGRPSR